MNESGSLSEGAGAKRLIVARAHCCAVGPHSGREGPTLGRACYPSRGIGSQRWIKQQLSFEATAMNCPDSLRHRLAAMPTSLREGGISQQRWETGILRHAPDAQNVIAARRNGFRFSGQLIPSGREHIGNDPAYAGFDDGFYRDASLLSI